MLSSYAFLVGVQSGALGRGAAIAMLLFPILLVIVYLRPAILAAAGHLSYGHRRRAPGHGQHVQRSPTPAKRLVRVRGLTFYAILAGLPDLLDDHHHLQARPRPVQLAELPAVVQPNGVTLDHLELLFNKTQFTTG